MDCEGVVVGGPRVMLKGGGGRALNGLSCDIEGGRERVCECVSSVKTR